MEEKKYRWYKIADSIDEINFSANGLTEVEVDDKVICIALHNGTIQACTYRCPHAGASLKNGYIDAIGNIVCPLHQYKFNLKNGRNVSGEGYYLKTFPLEVREEGLFVGIDNNSLQMNEK